MASYLRYKKRREILSTTAAEALTYKVVSDIQVEEDREFDATLTTDHYGQLMGRHVPKLRALGEASLSVNVGPALLEHMVTNTSIKQVDYSRAKLVKTFDKEIMDRYVASEERRVRMGESQLSSIMKHHTGQR